MKYLFSAFVALAVVGQAISQDSIKQKYYIITPLDVELVKTADGVLVKANTPEGVKYLHALFDMKSDATTWVPAEGVKRLLESVLVPGNIQLPESIPLKANIRLEFPNGKTEEKKPAPAPAPKVKLIIEPPKEKTSLRPDYNSLRVELDEISKRIHLRRPGDRARLDEIIEQLSAARIQGRVRHQTFTHSYSLYRK